jgi:protein ImuA
LLTLLARRYLENRRLVCIGRACWPSFQLLCAAAEGGTQRGKTHLLGRTLFLDPLTDQERFWAMGQALRCPGVAVVLADASKMDLNTSRRLQLAAEAGNRGEGMGPLALLARPYKELETPSWAATRWVVRSQRSARDKAGGDELKGEEPGHRWRLELKTCRGQLGGVRPAQDAPRDWNVEFTYQVFRGTGALHLSAGLGRGAAGAPEARAQSA